MLVVRGGMEDHKRGEWCDGECYKECGVCEEVKRISEIELRKNVGLGWLTTSSWKKRRYLTC